jgi:hypothetical protein
MSHPSQHQEELGNRPDPAQLLHDLEHLATAQKQHNHLRNLFLEEADLDEYIHWLDTDEDIDLTKKQISRLKAAIAGYREYLKEYLDQTGARIGRFEAKLKQSVEDLANPDLTPEEVDKIAHTRKRVAQAMQIAKKPRGAKGKSLREVTQKGAVSGAETKKELSPEVIAEYLGSLKTRFDALPELHKGVKWADVEKSLKADPESMRKLMALDEKGHEMNVFGEKNGKIQFRSAQTDVTKIAPEHRTIMYDKKAQTDYPQYNANGNAEDIAKSMGVDLADRELYEQLRVQSGWVWLETDAATRKTGDAIYGGNDGVSQVYADSHGDYGSFCAALRVKKA